MRGGGRRVRRRWEESEGEVGGESEGEVGGGEVGESEGEVGVGGERRE